MAASATLFAFMNLFARLASTTASWSSVAAVRALIGAVVALAVARARGASLAITDRRAVLLRALFGTGGMIGTFFAVGERELPLGDIVTLLNLSPIFVALISPFVLRERTTSAAIIAISTSIVGVVLVLQPTSLSSLISRNAPSAAPGLTAAVVAVLAALSSAAAMVMLRRAGATESPEAIALHFSLLAGITLSALALLDGRVPSARDLVWMLLAGVCGGFAQLAMTRAYGIERAALVSAMGYVSVVASALLGFAVLGESPRPLAIVGMALVIGSGVVAAFVGHERRDGPRRDVERGAERARSRRA